MHVLVSEHGYLVVRLSEATSAHVAACTKDSAGLEISVLAGGGGARSAGHACRSATACSTQHSRCTPVQTSVAHYWGVNSETCQLSMVFLRPPG